jgi:hypothetical protein
VTYQAVRARQHPDAFLKDLIRRSKGLPHAPRFTRGLSIPPEIEAALLKSRKQKPKYCPMNKNELHQHSEKIAKDSPPVGNPAMAVIEAHLNESCDCKRSGRFSCARLDPTVPLASLVG